MWIPKFFNVFLIIGYVTIVGLFTAMMILARDSDHSRILELKDLWSQNFISDFQIVDPGQYCPKGYFNILRDEYWPKTGNGCFCRIPITEKDCINWIGCSRILASEEAKYRYWKEQTICVKTFSKKMSYLDYARNSTTKHKCSANQKMCGKVGISYNLCVGVDEECPISLVKFINSNSQIPEDKKDFKVIQGRKINILYSNNGTKDYLPVNFMLSEEAACIDPGKRINTQYPLIEDEKVVETCKTASDFYNPVDSEPIQSLLKYNPKVQGKVIYLKGYFEKNNIFTIWAKPFISLQLNAVKEIFKEYYSSEDYIETLTKDSSTKFERARSCSLIGIIVTCLIVINVIINNCYDKFQKTFYFFNFEIINIALQFLFNLANIFLSGIILFICHKHPINFIYQSFEMSEHNYIYGGRSNIKELNFLSLCAFSLEVTFCLLTLIYVITRCYCETEEDRSPKDFESESVLDGFEFPLATKIN